jgi:hypothetical protein
MVYVCVLSRLHIEWQFSPAQTAAHFGAQVFGSDIDGRQMRGKGGNFGYFPPTICKTAAQTNDQESDAQPLNTALTAGL